jgi:site-specific DNA recombinase
MRAAIYTRVSTQKQVDEGYSLGHQRAKCEAFAKSKGWKAAQVFEDAGVSGGKKSRPALDRLVTAVEAGEVDVIISPHLDRIGRSAVHSHELYAKFDAAGIALWTPDGTKYDGTSPAGKMLRSIQAAAAEYERDTIKERTRAGAEAKKERGAFNGGPIPFGYELAEGGGLVICDTEAKWVRYMFHRYANEGASFYEIAKEVGESNVRTKRGGRWKGTKVSELIRSPVYVGQQKDGTSAQHEPLVTPEIFGRAQQRVATTRTLRGNGRGHRASAHLLSHGLLRCECGQGTTPMTDPNGRKYYRCRRKKADTVGDCSMPNLPQDLVDGAILSYLSEHVISDGLTAGDLEAEQENAVKDASKATSEALRAIRAAEDLEAKGEVKWVEGKIEDERWTELKARFAAQREQAEAALRTAEATEDALSEPDEEAIAAVERLRADLAAASTDASSLPRYRALIVKLFESVEVVKADPDAPAVLEDFPSTPSFIYTARKPVRGQPREHRIYLLPVLRPELAMLYGGDPMAFSSGSELIDRNACA